MPNRRNFVVSDTTPIIALSLLGHLEILRELYGEIVLPAAVHAEVRAGLGKPGYREIQEVEWIRVETLANPRQAVLFADLDQGEAEVIALALEHDADLVILDEKLARQFARRLQLTLTGTLGILLRAKQMGLLSAVKPEIERLRQNHIYLSKKVVAEVLRLASEE